MKHAIDSSFPEAKISETFLKFAEPILGNESGSLTAEETEGIDAVLDDVATLRNYRAGSRT